MSDTKTVREKCKHGRYERHQYQTSTFITKFWCEGGKETVLRQMWEPVESHRENDNQLTACWEFGSGAEAEIPPLWLEVVEE